MPRIQTLTLLITDIEGSTLLLRRLGDEVYAGALADHHRIVRAALSEHGGIEQGTQGDSFLASFASSSAALAAAADIQRRLAAHEWPAGEPVLVRIGLHSGETSTTETGLVGYEVHRAARVAGVSHGGQIVVSSTTAALARDTLPQGLSLLDLGSHRLKDLGHPEQLFQVCGEGLRADFPAVRSLDNPELANNLPHSLSRFVGRANELADVRRLIDTERLVTLVGPGGSGKTRLAMQVAASLLDGSGDGVWFVDLSAVAEPEQVAAAVLASMELRRDPRAPDQEVVARVLRDRDVVIVLDNCEHVIDAAAKLADLVVRTCEKVRVLATSREALGVDGESLFRVPPLSLPDEAGVDVRGLGDADATALFMLRLAHHEPTFVIDDAAAPIVAAICRRLDGIPLAIELAASRATSMSLRDLLEHLDQRFQVLTGGSRTAPARQQTLLATVAWSYDLLTEQERQVLRRLSVFVASFSLEGAEAVCASETLESFGIARIVGSLVAKSLVAVERSGDLLRYRLLETILRFGADQLLETEGPSELLAIRQLHGAHFLGLVERAAPELSGPDQGAWLRRLDVERENVLDALQFLAANAGRTEVIRFCTAASRYFNTRVDTSYVPVLALALEQRAGVPDEILAAGLLVMSNALLLTTADAEAIGRTIELSNEAVELARRTGDHALESKLFSRLSTSERMLGHASEALVDAERSLELATGVGDPAVLGRANWVLGAAQATIGDGHPYFERALRSFREAGDLEGVIHSLLMLAAGASTTLDEVRANTELIEEATTIAEQIGDVEALSDLWIHVSVNRALLGDFDAAAAFARRVLTEERRQGKVMWSVPAAFVLACCIADAGDARNAAVLLGACERIDTEMVPSRTWEWQPMELALRERCHSAAVAALGTEAFDGARATGRALTVAATADLALRASASPA